MRTRARTDANHTEIVKAFRSMGCTVQSLAAIGKGVPDLLVARRGNLVLVEVKDGSKCPSNRKLTELERRWHRAWKSQVCVVNSIEEACDVVNLHLS